MTSSTDQRAKAEKSELTSRQSTAAETEKALNAILVHLNELNRARPTVRICEGKTGRTRTTIEKILKAANQVFTQKGHAGLSLRKVAEKAGIAVGNLTYHFPTKHALLDAMMREELAVYVEEHLAHFEANRNEPLEILLNVVEFYVRNARESHQFFFQLWGFAGSSEEGRKMVRELYRPIGGFVYHLVRAANPDLTDIEVRQAILQIFSLEEGYKLFIGMGAQDSPAIAAAEKDIRTLTRRIICAA